MPRDVSALNGSVDIHKSSVFVRRYVCCLHSYHPHLDTHKSSRLLQCYMLISNIMKRAGESAPVVKHWKERGKQNLSVTQHNLPVYQ